MLVQKALTWKNKYIGTAGKIRRFGLGEDGLKRRNPMAVVLGDSVTLGHFELTAQGAELLYSAQEIFEAADVLFPAEITDSYLGLSSVQTNKIKNNEKR